MSRSPVLPVEESSRSPGTEESVHEKRRSGSPVASFTVAITPEERDMQQKKAAEDDARRIAELTITENPRLAAAAPTQSPADPTPTQQQFVEPTEEERVSPVGSSDDENTENDNTALRASASATACMRCLMGLISSTAAVVNAARKYPATTICVAALATIVTLEAVGCAGKLGKKSEEMCYKMGRFLRTEPKEGMVVPTNGTSETPMPDVIPDMPMINTLTKVAVPVITGFACAFLYAATRATIDFCTSDSRRSHDTYQTLPHYYNSAMP